MVSCIETIGKECLPEASFGAKENALETLRKIGKTVCLSGDTIGHEVRKQFQGDTCLVDKMLDIAESMTQEERDEVTDTEWSDKLHELVKLSKDRFIYEGLSKLVVVMDGEFSEHDSTTVDE